MAKLPRSHKNISMHILLGFRGYDHKNRNALDNRKENLRPCTPQENSRNKSLSKNNNSGVTGVSWDSKKLKWRSRIGIDYKNVSLGYFKNKEDAIKARLKAELEYFGEFAP